MSTMPEGVTSVRIDKLAYERFKESCTEKGLIAPKQIGFILEGILETEMFDLMKAGWKAVEVRKQQEQSRKEKCGDTLTHQHRIGTHPEEGQVSKENDNATSDIIVSGGGG